MELFDYVRFRWLPFLGLFILGAVAIVAYGHSSAGTVYTAKAQMLVRPPISNQSGYGSDGDRYIGTQMALMYTSDYLEAEVNDTDVTPGELASSLSYTHAAGSEIVTLQVSGTNGVKAIAMVNAAVDGYLAYAQKLASQPSVDVSTALDTQIARARKQLNAANVQIQKTVAAYAAASPDDRLPNSDTLAPRATGQAALSTARLQQLLQLQATQALSNAQNAFRSSLLRSATRASLPGGWGRTTYLATLAGLVLALLVLAGVGLAFTHRIISEARWNASVQRGNLGHPVRVRRLTGGQRRQSVRRVQMAFAAVSAGGANTWTIALPEETKVIRRKTAFLIKQLEEAGVTVGAIQPVTAALAPGSPVSSENGTGSDGPAIPDRVLLLVDLNRANIDDASGLTDYPAAIQRLIVPVLV